MDKEAKINNVYNEFTSYYADPSDKTSNKMCFDKSDQFSNYENDNRLKQSVNN